MKLLIYSSRVYTHRGPLEATIEIDGKFIKAIYPGKHKEENVEFMDLGDLYIFPGLIEMHLHGFMGFNAMSTDPDEIQSLCNVLTTQGITGYLPTNHYSDSVFENNRAIIKVKNNQKVGARILGIHMEGPFISQEKLGSVLVEETHPVDLDLMEKYIETSDNNIVTVTMAPELQNADELIMYLVQNKINVCLGHSNATYEEAKKAIDLGASVTQKTGNCMRNIHQRDVGMQGAAILDMRLFNEINSDLAHVSKEYVEILYRLKGYEKLCIVADSGVMSGMPKGCYHLPDRGIYHVGPDELLHIEDGTLDGSIHSMFYGFCNWIKVMNVPIEEAVVMGSLNPAKVLGIDSIRGSIKEGKYADMFVMNDNFDVLYTFVEGNLEYSKGEKVPLANQKVLSYQTKAYK